MKRPRIRNACANATFFFILLALLFTSSFAHHSLARREADLRKPMGRHRPPRRPPRNPTVLPPPPPGASRMFSVLRYGAVGDGATNDTKAFADAWSAACTVRASTVVTPAGYVFLVGPITFTGDSCESDTIFQVDGKILANTGSTAWPKQWLQFKNVRGLTIQGGGTIDGQGSHWWNRRAGGDDATTELLTDHAGTSHRPTAVRVFQGANVTVTGITLRNSAKFHLTIDTCRDVVVRGVTVSSPGDSPNTDGIHLAGSTGVSIHHATISCGDDCISIQDGCSDVLIRRVDCGPGHGISIGGLGKGGATAFVSDVAVHDVTLTGTTTGVRIKTWQGGSGWVKNVRFTDVRASAVRTPIVIDQYYCDHATCANQTSAVAVSGVAYRGVAGTYTERPVYLACSDAAPCSGIHLADIQLAPVKDAGHHLRGPFCWNAYGDEVRPVEPPVDCLMARAL
ncbi:hypothetical protein ACP70R_022454 [Stipagrostis hirtigluma subsp. patula]